MKPERWFERKEWTEENGTAVVLQCGGDKEDLSFDVEGQGPEGMVGAGGGVLDAEHLSELCKSGLWGRLGARVYLQVFEWATKHGTTLKGFDGLPHWWAFEELKKEST